MSGVKQKSGLWGAAVPALAEESNSGPLTLEYLWMTPRRLTIMLWTILVKLLVHGALIR